MAALPLRWEALCLLGIFTVTAFATDIVIQVRMGPFIACTGITDNNKAQLHQFFQQAIINGTHSHCNGCTISSSNFQSYYQLLCDPTDPHYLTYLGLITSESAYLLQPMEDWVVSEDTVSYNFVSLTVDSNCPLQPTDTNGCSDQKPTCTPETSGFTVNTFVGGLLAELVVLSFVFFVVLGCVVWFCSSRQNKLYKELRRCKVRRRLNSSHSTHSSESFKQDVAMKMHSCEAYATTM